MTPCAMGCGHICPRPIGTGCTCTDHDRTGCRESWQARWQERHERAIAERREAVRTGKVRHGWTAWWGEGKRPAGPNGEKLCKMCPAPIAKGRREYCSEACREAYLVRTSGSYARAMVARRDRGVCAECGLDTEDLRRAYHEAETRDHATPSWQCGRCEVVEAVTPEPERFWPAWAPSGLCARPVLGDEAVRCGGVVRQRFPETERAAVVERMRAHGFPVVVLRAFMAGESYVHLWEADHLTPVVEGGGACGLENLRTLCIPCHRRATADLAKRRKHARRMAKAFAERGRTLF